MSRGLLFEEGIKTKFSGHETFPLRYGWLKKTYDMVLASENDEGGNKGIFSDDAIARFGVGKNMVDSIKHWAFACGVIKDSLSGDGSFSTAEIGRFIFDEDNGVDPYLEFPSSLWLLHWMLASHPEKTTTWYWVFNHFPSKTFDKDQLNEGLKKLYYELNGKEGSATTLKRDVECFIRTYVPKNKINKSLYEDNLESPLAELSLIKALGKRDGFQMVRGPKTTLFNGVFVYALNEFLQRHTISAKTLSLETIAYEPGSPGRVFLLDEVDLTDRLSNLSDITGGLFTWSETAGLRQVFVERPLTQDESFEILRNDFNFSETWETPDASVN